MKKYLTYALTAFFAMIAVSIAGSEQAMIEAKEKAAWQAFKDRKHDDFKKAVDKDLRCVYADGISIMEKDLADMQKWDIKSFEFGDYKSFTDEPDVIVTTYTV